MQERRGAGAAVMRARLRAEPVARRMLARMPAWAAVRYAAPAALAWLTLVAPAAGASRAWEPFTSLSAPGLSLHSPRIAVDPLGNAVAAWEHDGMVKAAVRPVDRAWQRPADLSVPGSTSGGPDLAIDSRGNALAVWQTFQGSGVVIQAASRPAGGAWQPPVTVSTVGGDSRSPRVAVDGLGGALVVWHHGEDSNPTAVRAATRSADGSWQMPVNLSGPVRFAGSPQVAVNPRGDAVVVWQRSADARLVVQAATRPAGGAWEPAVDIAAPDPREPEPQVAIDPEGNAIAVWQRYERTDSIVQAAVRPPGAGWGAPVDLSEPGGDAENPQLAVDPQGNAVVVWTRDEHALMDIARTVPQSAFRPAHGSWQAAADIAPKAEGVFADVAFGARGDAVAVWANRGVKAAVRPPGGRWRSPKTISDGRRLVLYQQVAVDPRGNAFAVWAQSPGMRYTVQGARYGEPFVRLTSLRLSRHSFTPARTGPSVRAAPARRLPRVRYTLDAPATVRLTVERAVAGRSLSGSCVAATSATRRLRRCTRYVRVRGTFTRTRPAGTDRFTFSGRLAGRALAPGRYRLVATPIAANGVRERARHAGFTVAS